MRLSFWQLRGELIKSILQQSVVKHAQLGRRCRIGHSFNLVHSSSGSYRWGSFSSTFLITSAGSHGLARR
jgi:hypothetical protein